MSREEKRVTELVRQRMKESHSMEMLGFDVESVREGRAIFRLDVKRTTNRFTAWCTAEFWRRWRIPQRDRGLYGDSQGSGNRDVELSIIIWSRCRRAHQGGRARAARGEKFRRDRMRNFQRGWIAGRKGPAHLRSQVRTFSAQIENLLVAALGRFFAILVDVLNHALKDEQVGTALACELDAIAVIPLDRTAKDFTTVQDNGHRGMDCICLTQ